MRALARTPQQHGFFWAFVGSCDGLRAPIRNLSATVQVVTREGGRREDKAKVG